MTQLFLFPEAQAAAPARLSQAEKCRIQCERAGLASFAELRREAHRRFAVESGWPDDLRIREVQILNVLAENGMPMSKGLIAEAIGMKGPGQGTYGRKRLLGCDEGTYTGCLLRRGLIIVIRRGGMENGRKVDTYALSVSAVELLMKRNVRCQNTQTDESQHCHKQKEIPHRQGSLA